VTWADARTQLATILGTVSITSPIEQTIKRVYATPPGTVQDRPCFIIFPPALTVERHMGGLRIDHHRIRIALLTLDADKDVAADIVEAYREAFADMLDANVTLNGTVTQIEAQETEEGSSVTFGGVEYQGCITFLTVETKRSVTYAP
jgi:hypothetical protein